MAVVRKRFSYVTSRAGGGSAFFVMPLSRKMLFHECGDAVPAHLLLDGKIVPRLAVAISFFFATVCDAGLKKLAVERHNKSPEATSGTLGSWGSGFFVHKV